MVSDKCLDELRRGVRKGLNLSFAGCGFLGIYHVGVASCLKEYAPHLIADKISGASAGGLVACAMIADCCLGECTKYTLNLALEARSRALGPLHPNFNLVEHLRKGLTHFLPSDAHKTATGRLHLSLTRVSDRQNVLVSQYDSKEDLIQALICSAFVPFYCGLIPPKYKDVRYVDGGLSDNIPILDENTISVSPFAGESDICPNDGSASFMHVHLAGTSIQVNTGNLYRFSHAFFPPHPEVLSQMCRRGFDDALAFLQNNNLLTCARHLTFESSLFKLGEEETDPTLDKEESCLSLDEWDEEEYLEDDYEDECADCDDCKHQQRVALVNSLPPSVLLALQSACDAMNKGILNPVYNLRVFKVLSLMSAPWLFPWEFVLVLAKRFWQWAPHMPQDMQWFVAGIIDIIRNYMKNLQKRRHKYSARLTCQLALTEVDLDFRCVDIHMADIKKMIRLEKQIHREKKIGFSLNYNSTSSSNRVKLEHQQHVSNKNVPKKREKLQELENVSDRCMPESNPQPETSCKLHSANLPTIHSGQELGTDMLTMSVGSFEQCLHIAQETKTASFYLEDED